MQNIKLIVFMFMFDGYAAEFPTVVCGGDLPVDIGTLEDSLMAYIDSVYEADMEYQDVVEDVLNTSGYEWKFVGGKVPACDDGIAFIYI